MKILEVRPEQVIVLDRGVVTTRPNSPYYSLKYFHYDEKRIAYTFSDTSFIQETFDARIFNCWCNGKRIQLRQDLSDKLATTINQHIEYKTLYQYEDLFKFAYEEIPEYYFLERYLNNVEGVVHDTKQGFIVYDSFKIDFKGNAWIKKGHTSYNMSSDEEWISLCIVMQGSTHSNKADEGRLPDEYGEVQTINALTMTIISKIIFLLNPNLEDTAYTSQLSKTLLSKLRQIKGGENEK